MPSKHWYTFYIYRQVELKDQLHIPSTSSCLDTQIVVTTDTGHNYGKADGNAWDCHLCDR